VKSAVFCLFWVREELFGPGLLRLSPERPPLPALLLRLITLARPVESWLVLAADS